MRPRDSAVMTLALAGFWMLLWASFGAFLSAVARLIDPAVIGPGEGPVDVALILAGVGVVAGAAFGVLLALAERGGCLSMCRSRARCCGACWRGSCPGLSG